MSSHRIGRLSPVLIVAFLALVIAVAGVSSAAASSGPNGHAVAAKKRHKHRRHHRKTTSNPSNGNNGSNGSKGQTGATGPQGPKGDKGDTGPSDGFVTRIPANLAMTGATDNTVAQLSLPANSNYIVTAAVELGNNAASDNSVNCSILENNNPVASGTEALIPLATFSRTLTLTAAVTGGTIKYSCTPDKGSQARNRVITAIRVGTLTSQ